MACMRLGSKPEAFHREGETWHCMSGLPSDVTVKINESSFHLHKFPLLSRSGLLERLINEATNEGSDCIIEIHDIPGGAKAFELATKFCYGIKLELTALNAVSLRCAAEYLQMTEDYGEGNLISQIETFLNEVFSSWTDTIKALERCEEVLPYAEELHIVSRCINSLAMKACSDPSLFGWPVSGQDTAKSSKDTILWNGIPTETKQSSVNDDWWYEDVSFLSLPLYKRLIVAITSNGLKAEKIAGSVAFYAMRHLPLMNGQQSGNNTNHVNPGTTISIPSEADQRAFLEEIVNLLPNQKGVAQTKFLLRLLRMAMMLQASSSCRENLEKRAGAQLDQAAVEDLLIPNKGYTVETLYDIECVQRIVDHFMSLNQLANISSPSILEEDQLMDGSYSLTSMTMVANLVDAYLAEVAPDVNLKFPKFQQLAAVIPDYARPLADGIYHAIDIYLKNNVFVLQPQSHPWLTEAEREQICRLMNCQKLSLDASTHAAQNERLPLRVVVQVLFFEQLRLRTSISGWFFVSDNLDSTQNPSGSLGLGKNDHTQHAHSNAASFDDVRERVSELEKECLSMRQELRKLGKTKRRWNFFSKTFGFGERWRSTNLKNQQRCNVETQPSSAGAPQKHEMGEVGVKFMA
ncbi:BTB/POZ domain [Dillenia turbinata]|uniref:BTB/POZ domain n=1 Tax=Dillenia turbinata TaxID=194707 RepID=A0AAN8ZQA8_9MAGN